MTNPIPTIVMPSPPRVPTQPESWLFDDDPELELSEVTLDTCDLSLITSLDAEQSILTSVTLGPSLAKVRLHDVVLEKVQMIGFKPETVAWGRVEISNSRLTGADFGGSFIEDCTFTGTKLDEAGFKLATLTRVVFDNCVLTRADFSSSQLRNIVFKNCTVDGMQLSGAICRRVDVRKQDITGIKGVLGLKGSIISSEQLLQIAPLLAAELDFSVDE
jgi:uncharacterized protein YjbI with pentapeptide repeats